MDKNHPVLKEADRFEPRVARAIKRAAYKLRLNIRIDLLTIAIANKDVRAAMASLPDISDSYTPVGDIIKDAVLRGGRVSEKLIHVKR